MLRFMPRLAVPWATGCLLIGTALGLQGCGGGSGSSATGDACVTYWVSTAGNDATGDGSMGQPFATVDRARLAVRGDPRRGVCKIDVNIMGGVYALKAPLVFDTQDSGATGHEVVYQAAPGNSQPVVLSGGLPVSGFQCSGGRCVAPVPDLPPGVMPRQFYVDDQRALRARSNTATPINPDYRWVSNGYQAVGTPPTLTHPELVEAVTTTQWKMMRCPVGANAGGVLSMVNPCWNNANTFPKEWSFYQLSWLENAPEFLTDPHMWYLDPYAKTVTYLMGASTPPQSAYLPILESLLQIQGRPSAPVTGLQFRNLQFEGYPDSGVGNHTTSTFLGHSPVFSGCRCRTWYRSA